MLNQRLAELRESYPLPESVSAPESFLNEVSVEELSVKAVGLAVKTEKFGEVVASAVGLTGGVLDRAYFELIERLAILEFESSVPSEIQAMDDQGQLIAEVDSELVFPRSCQPGRWTYSKSNGVAAHQQFSVAAAKAEGELIERDRVLRSWYGAFVPSLYSCAEHPVSIALFGRYSFYAADFGKNIAGVFGFPRTKGIPIAMGFSGGPTQQKALDHAFEEALQRIVFLQDERETDQAPAFTPSVQYHLNYYLRTGSSARIQKWVFGERNECFTPRQSLQSDPGQESCFWVDLTPQALRGRLSVLKAVRKDFVPLTFGLGNPHFDFVGEEMEDSGWDPRVHPIA